MTHTTDKEPVTLPLYLVNDLLALCTPEDHELRDRVKQAARRAQVANGKGWGGSGTSMIDGHAVSSESDCMTCSGHGAVGNVINAEPCPDCTPPSHSMSQYASKDDMLKAVMAENEQLRAQLAAAQQGVQQSIEQDVREIVGLLKNREWAEHIGQTELGRELEHEITKLYNATHPTPQGLDAQTTYEAACFRWLRDESLKARRSGPVVFMTDESGNPNGVDGWGDNIMTGEALERAIPVAAQAKQGGASHA